MGSPGFLPLETLEAYAKFDGGLPDETFPGSSSSTLSYDDDSLLEVYDRDSFDYFRFYYSLMEEILILRELRSLFS